MSERITATLPMDGLLFWKLEGEEALSEAFTLQVTLLSTDARIERRALLGQPITLSIPVQGLLATRYLNGKITRVKVHSEELNGTRYAVYSLTMEPDLWPMKRDRNLRIFQNQTVPQIIKSLLHQYNVTTEDKLSGRYRLWEYCVQYQESSFDFISRLMELEGIYYFFRHQQDQHVMVLMDTVSQHQPFPGYETIPYHVTASGGVTSEEGVSRWALEDHVTPGIYSLDDYDFRQPNAMLFKARQNPVSPSPGEIDVYDWPGHYVEHQHGENYARIRQQVWQAAHQKISGSGTALGIAPGHTFLLHNAPWLSDNGEYLTIKAEYQFAENRYASGSDDQSEKQIDFIVIPVDCPFRAAPKTPWPKTCGPQTAKVVGPRGESIWTDKYGRIKVKFHWDRLAKGDDSSSCWVRVSSAWAGQGFGGVQIPRVNDEVVIDFINGDPDRPLVIGRVYNEASMPPWSLPAAATQMGFISRSKDGTPDNANALRFEDKAGAEQVWIQAERNMDTHIKHNASQHIGSNHTHFVGASEQRRVAENQMQAVKGARELLTGSSKLDAVVDGHVLAAGTVLRLECGKSAIELTAAGKINLVGTGFNIFVEGDGLITTSGGALTLNTEGGIPATSAPGDGHRALILQAVEEKFLPEKEGKSQGKGIGEQGVTMMNAIKKTNDNSKKKAPVKNRPAHVQKFIEDNLIAAKKVQSDWGVPVSVTLAQAAQETGWGAHVKNNAWFGIKGKSPAGNTADFKTSEVIDGKRISITDSFRSYESFAEAADDHGRFLVNNPRYKNAFSFKDDPAAFVDEIAKAGYATDPNYAKSLKNIISAQHLSNFDRD
ncbi:type VI secretion system tip protein TssI/VgrG [Winslowiella iniecta]|uniref:Type IV secretion protein Rhs n=3 Tax=Winslowiella iniecta TaxID=1560201 RepID=A0A0L7SY68_9GAMM|nr:type VI secretion system tip protein TssI/VgrG [Winslowiella iniecta]KOC88094.1 type IV secretion protein Rhs [Winslowiella iniecta]